MHLDWPSWPSDRVGFVIFRQKKVGSMDTKSVSVVVPCLTEHDWQVDLTQCVIRIAHHTTQVPFELVICEAVGDYLDGKSAYVPGLDWPEPKYYRNPRKGFANADQNAGMDLATGDIVVLLTNDVFVKPGWLEALLECFKIPDCGMASLGTSDHKEVPAPFITEGLWCPLMALLNRPDFKFNDETFPSYWGDSDLVMTVYNKGYRAYRNRRIVCDHLGRATNTETHPSGRAEEIEAAKGRFIEKHNHSHTLIYRMLMDGLII